jgi:hypothetical protein
MFSLRFLQYRLNKGGALDALRWLLSIVGLAIDCQYESAIEDGVLPINAGIVKLFDVSGDMER